MFALNDPVKLTACIDLNFLLSDPRSYVLDADGIKLDFNWLLIVKSSLEESPKVTFPDTIRLPVAVISPFTVKLPVIILSPSTVSELPKVNEPSIFPFPFTSKSFDK